jgi:hypothetical protein
VRKCVKAFRERLDAGRLDQVAPFRLQPGDRLLLLVDVALQRGNAFGDGFRLELDLEDDEGGNAGRRHGNDLQPADHA